MEHEVDGDTKRNQSTWNKPKILVKRQEDFVIREEVETIQTAELLRSGRIVRRVLET